MGRRKHHHIPRRTTKSPNLDGTLDTTGTEINRTKDNKESGLYKRSEKLEPPFKGDEGGSFIRRSEVSLTWKVAGVVGAIFLGVGVPVIWFTSSLSSNVNSLGKDVTEIKGKTDRLIEKSIRSEERLKNAEKSINGIAQTLNHIQKNWPSNQNQPAQKSGAAD